MYPQRYPRSFRNNFPAKRFQEYPQKYPHRYPQNVSTEVSTQFSEQLSGKASRSIHKCIHAGIHKMYPQRYPHPARLYPHPPRPSARVPVVVASSSCSPASVLTSILTAVLTPGCLCPHSPVLACFVQGNSTLDQAWEHSSLGPRHRLDGWPVRRDIRKGAWAQSTALLPRNPQPRGKRRV